MKSNQKAMPTADPICAGAAGKIRIRMDSTKIVPDAPEIILDGSRFLRACLRKPVDRTPVWFLRQAGRYMQEYRDVRKHHTLVEICKKPELAAEVTITAAEKLGVDAAIIFADLLLPLEPMGLDFEFQSGEGPVVHCPIRTAEDVRALRTDRAGDLGYVALAIEKVAAHFRGRMGVIGFCGAPYTLASYMIEGGSSKSFLTTKRFLYEQPKAAHRLFGLLADTLGTYLAAQVRAGASAVQIFDSWGGELSPQDYATWGVPYLQRIAAAVKKEGAPLILFATGSSGMLEVLKGVGADCLGLDWRIEIDAARARLGPDVAVQGNLDPCALFLPPEQLEARVRDILRRAGQTGHVFNLGHGILPPTAPESAQLLVELVHRHSQRPNG